MEYKLEQRPAACIMRIEQDLTASDDPELKRVFVRMRQSDDINIAMDMRSVAFMDSTVLGTLVWALKNFREAGGDLRLFGLKDFVKKLFDVTMLDKAFQIYDAESSAIESFGEALDS